MRGYPLKEWRTECGYYSTYALAHVLGWDFRYYIRFVGMVVNHLSQGQLGIRSPMVYATSRHRKINGGWLFVDAETLDLLLQRRGWPTTADIFASLNLGVSPLDYLSDVFPEDRVIIDDFHQNSNDFLEYSHCILPRCQKVDSLLNNLSRNRKKCRSFDKKYARVNFRRSRLKLSARRVGLSRIQLEIPARTVAGVKGLS